MANGLTLQFMHSLLPAYRFRKVAELPGTLEPRTVYVAPLRDSTYFHSSRAFAYAIRHADGWSVYSPSVGNPRATLQYSRLTRAEAERKAILRLEVLTRFHA